jgi:formate C-acetyltransferase
VIPDVRPLIRRGALEMIRELDGKIALEADPEKKANFRGMFRALEAAVMLAGRYARLAEALAAKASGEDRARLDRIRETLEKVPARGADTLREAIQSFMILWQVMCAEQAPNPFAFSVGNADRIFEPYRAAEGLTRAEAAAYLTHLLVFLNVGDRSWAISQNLIVGGRDGAGRDLTNETSYRAAGTPTLNEPAPADSVGQAA